MAANYITAVGVQQFSIKIGAAATSATATINTVGSGAFILWGGNNPSVANNPAEDFAYCTLTNSTTITATRNTSTGTVTLNGCIIDGDTTNLIKSVQYGTATIANLASTGTAAITGVTNANTAVHLLGWQSANTTLSGINEYPIVTLSGTTVTATRVGVAGALVVGFVVIEFQSGCLNQSVQNIAATNALSVTSYTAAVTSVVTNNSICLYAGSNTAVVTTNVAEVKQYGSLTSSTVFTVNVNTAVANAKSYNCSVVEFKSGVLKSAVQRNTTTLTAVKQNQTVLSSVNSFNTAIDWLGNTTTATTAVLNQAEGQVALQTPGTVVQSIDNTGATGSITISFASATVAGNFIVAVICAPSGSTNTVTGVTDTASQTYTQVPGARATSTSAGFVDMWYFPNSSSITSVTVNSTISGTTTYVQLYEVYGIKNSGSIDVASALSTATGASNLCTTNAINTAAAYDLIIAAVSTSIASTTAVNAPFTTGGTDKISGFYNPTTTVSSQSCSFHTSGAAQSYCATIVGFLSTTTPAATVSKQSATSNLVGSWEVFEFPAFVNTLNAIWFGAIA